MYEDLKENESTFERVLFSIARLLWPGLEQYTWPRRLIGTGDVVSFLYALPFALIGWLWLLMVTNWELIGEQWPMLAFIFGLIVLFDQVSYFFIVEIRTDRYGSANGSLANMVHWSGLFLFGASGIWLLLIWLLLKFIWQWQRAGTTAGRWNMLRNLTFEQAINSFGVLVALRVYRTWGGVFPIGGLSSEVLTPALIALTTYFLLAVFIWSGYIVYHIWVQTHLSRTESAQPILRFFALSFGLPYLAHPFAILASGLFVQSGLVLYIFFLTGFFLVALLARQLSWMAESSRQQSRQLEKLEQLGRAIIDAPPDTENLPEILREHVPNMFPSGKIAIALAPDQLLLHHPDDWSPPSAEAWRWLMNQEVPEAFIAAEPLPWDEHHTKHSAVAIAPILETESNEPIGGIYLELRALVQRWDRKALQALFPALQTLAAQIASAIRQSEIYSETLEFQAIAQELHLAGRIQASFLPNRFPSIPGWQLAMTLLPARETSGDFFDVIELPDGRLGILIADVADKGLGPALYMALTRTLIRTYAIEYEADPAVVFYAANNRLLRDARANLFVTAFYGILDPSDGIMTFANAGHNPPLLFCGRDEGEVKFLTTTGMPMGVESEATWEQDSVSIKPGDAMLLYTDGVPDAQNPKGEFFNEDRLVSLARSNLHLPAHELQKLVLSEVQKFVGGAPQFDDITLMVLFRDN